MSSTSKLNDNQPIPEIAASRLNTQIASASLPPADQQHADQQARLRATYRTLRNDAEYAHYEQQMLDAAKEIKNLREASQSFASKLLEIENSRGYKLLQSCRAVRLFLLPRHSKRERLCAACYRALRSTLRWTRDCVKLPFAARRSNCQPSEKNGLPPSDFAREQNLPGNLPHPEEKLALPSLPALDNEKLHDPGTDWHLGFGNIRFTPLTWKGSNDSQSDDRFIKLVVLSNMPRSGSTLLQRLCNARKETLIWGEHGGLLQHYADIYAGTAYFSAVACHQRIAYFENREDPNRWIANMTPDLEFVQQATIESARTFLNTLYGQYSESHDIIGFKEVRYVRGEIELLRKCYPEAEFLLLFRNPLNTWNSTPKDWYPSLEAWISKWNRYGRCFLDLAKSDPHCHLLRYEDLMRQNESTMTLLADVAKVTPEHVGMVMGHKLGSIHSGVSEQERQTILEQCHEMMTALGYLDA